MSAPLTPCVACRRHARSTDPACPFCGGALSPVRAFAEVDTRGLSRAAVIALAASLGLAACVSEDTPVYGAPGPGYVGGAGGAGGAGGEGGAGAAGADAAGGEAGAGGK